MRILTVSDIHGQFREFNPATPPEADVILIAGNLTNLGLRAPALWKAQAELQLEQAQVWFKALSRRCEHVYWVQGNHDMDLPDDFFDPFARNVRDQTVPLEHNGHHFSLRGVSLTCAFDHPDHAIRWAFTTADPLEDARVFNFGYHDIILSHGPPLHCLDRTKSGLHIGSPALQKHILEHQPQLVICGHVHEAAGVQGIKKTMVVNTACRWQLVTLAVPKKGVAP
jgi:uncharacterized protein